MKLIHKKLIIYSTNIALLLTIASFSSMLTRSLLEDLMDISLIWLISLITWTIIFVAIALIYRAVKEFKNRKLGASIRLKFIILFSLVSIISSTVTTLLFLNIVDNIKQSLESKKETMSSILESTIKLVSELHSDEFEKLRVSVENNISYPDITASKIKLNTLTRNKILEEIKHYSKRIDKEKDKALLSIDGEYFLVYFSKSKDSLKVGYKKANKYVVLLNEKLNKVLTKTSRIEFILNTIFDDFLIYIIFLINIPPIIISIPIAYAISHYFSLSIRNLLEGTKQIEEGNLGYIVPEKHAFDELRELTKSFNIMSMKLLEAQYMLLKIEKIELWKDIARKISHEIKNPLTPIKLSIQRLLANPEIYNFKEKAIDSLSIILEEINRIDKLVNQLSSVAKIPQPNKTLINLSEILKDIIKLFSETEMKFNMECSDLIISADKEQIKQALINLVKNAVEASINKSKIIDIGCIAKEETVTVYVRDYGVGIPENIKENILKSYITTKKDGTGLGLSIVENIVVNHKGKLYFESTPDHGTTFFVELPYR